MSQKFSSTTFNSEAEEFESEIILMTKYSKIN